MTVKQEKELDKKVRDLNKAVKELKELVEKLELGGVHHHYHQTPSPYYFYQIPPVCTRPHKDDWTPSYPFNITTTAGGSYLGNDSCTTTGGNTCGWDTSYS